MQNFKTSRFEFTPQFLPSEEIDSPYAVSNRNPRLSKSSDRAYPRRDELFQDENGNLYLYKVINGVHKYVKISADAYSGSDNGTVINSDVFLPYERLAKLEKQSLNSAIFEDGVIAVVDSDKLKFYKQSETERELEAISNSDITLTNDQAEYLQHKFGVFTYKHDEASFRVIIGHKFVSGNSTTGTVTIQAFKLNSDLNSNNTTYKLEAFGSPYSWSNGQEFCPQVHILKDDENGNIRIYAVNAIINATVSPTGIMYDPDQITQSDSNLYSAGIVSGNTNAMLDTGYTTHGMKLYMQGIDGYLSIPRGGNKSSNYIAILNIKRDNTRPSTTGSYGIVSISNNPTDESSYVYTTDFSNGSVVENTFDLALEDGESFIRVLDNSQILNHANIQDGYEKIVMSFVVLTEKNGIYNAYLYYVAPNKAEVANGGSNLNEPYEDSTYSIIRVGKYQFNGSEEITKMETTSYIYLLDNGNILENRSTGIVLYAASQFRYLSATFADSLFAANLQAINIAAKFAEIDYINNKKIASEETFTKTLESNSAIASTMLNSKLGALPKDTTDRVNLDGYTIPGVSGYTTYSLCKTSAHTTFVFNELIVSLNLYSSKIYIFDIENNKEYIRSFSFSDSRVTPSNIIFTNNNGNFVINASRYGHLYGCVTLQSHSFVFYVNKTLNEIIESEDAIEFTTIEDNTTIYNYDNATQLQERSFYTRTGNSIIQVYQHITSNNLAYIKETCIEIDEHRVDINKKDNIYRATDKLISTSLSIQTYWKNVSLSGYTVGYTINILRGCAPGLVCEDYLFIPFNFVPNSDGNTTASIIRVFRPSVKYDASSVSEEVTLKYNSSNYGTPYITHDSFDYEPLETGLYNDSYFVLCTALGSDLVRYVDLNQNIVNVFFKSRLDGDNCNLAYKEVSQKLKDSITPSSFYNAEYIVCGNRIYEYAGYRGLRLVFRELCSNENDFVPLYNSDEADYPSNDSIAFITAKYILFTRKEFVDSAINFQRISHILNTGNFSRLSSSHADIASIDSGYIHTVKLSTNHILLDDMHLEAKTSLIEEDEFSIGERQALIESANEYVKYATKGKVQHYSFIENASVLNYSANTERNDSLFYPVFKNPVKGNYLYAKASYTSNTNTITLSLYFANAFSDSMPSPSDALGSSVFYISIKPKEYDQQMSAAFFNNIANSSYDYLIDVDEYFNAYYCTRHMHINNTRCTIVHNDTNGESKITGMTPDEKDITLFSLRIGARRDINGNVFVYFNDCYTFNEDITKLECIFKSDNPVVIQVSDTSRGKSWKVWNDDNYDLYKPTASIMASSDTLYGYCKLVTNINYIRYQWVSDKKIVYFPALIHTNANKYTAINAVMMIGVYDSNNNTVNNWMSINLNTTGDNDLLHGINTDFFVEYSSDDILLDNIPYIVDTMLDTTSYVESGTSRTAYKFTIAVNAVETPSYMGHAREVIYTPDRYYGLYKSNVQISRSGFYRNLQYQHTVLAGVIYKPSSNTISVTNGSYNLSPEAVLLPVHDEHKELYSSAKLLKNFGGIFVTNRLGPNPELENNFIESNYAKYNKMFKPTFYVGFSGDYYDNNGTWSYATKNPIFYSNNKFRSTSSFSMYDWNSTELLMSSLIVESLGDWQGYNILTCRHDTGYNSNNILDLTKAFGYVKDSPGSDSYFNIYSIYASISRNNKYISIYSPLPKDFTEYPDDSTDASTYSKLFFSMYVIARTSGSSIFEKFNFATACILHKGNTPYTSIAITNAGKFGGWLNYEQQYGSSSIYATYSASDARRNVFSKYNLSTTSYNGSYGAGNVYPILINHEYFGNTNAVINIATDKRSIILTTIEPSYSYKSGLLLAFIPIGTSINNVASHVIPGSEIYTSERNYAEMPIHNAVRYIDENQKNNRSLLFIVTSSAVYAYDSDAANKDDYISMVSISDLEMLSNNYIYTYYPGGSVLSLPDFYEGSDYVSKNGIMMINNTEDTYPSKSAGVYLDMNLFLNGRQVVIKE